MKPNANGNGNGNGNSHRRNNSNSNSSNSSNSSNNNNNSASLRKRNGKRNSQKQPSFTVIDSSIPHSDLHFYDIHTASLPRVSTDSLNNQDQKLSSRRRRNKKPQQNTTCPKSRDLYADLIIVFKFIHPSAKGGTLAEKSELEQQTLVAYQDILTKLTNVGLQYETRPSGKETVLIFVLCPWSTLKREVVRNSLHDWLTGVKVADMVETEQLLKPAKERDQSLDDLTDSVRIRLIHDLITANPNEGGAGIYPGENDFVESILPLHDWEFNKNWLKSWSTKWVVNHNDLSRIRDHFGEKVAYYFEFLEFYFLWLIIPTSLGILVHFFGSSFSIFYSFSVIIWAIVYIESWKRRERELALWWGVRNVKKSEARRHAFKGDTIIVDPVTDEHTPFFSPWKRWARKIAGVPVIFAGALALSVLVTFMFGVEVFLEVYYDGYMKEVLVYLPTVLYTLAMPYVEETCNSIAKWLTDFENHETDGSYDYHLVQKVFIFKVLNSYLSILLTAFVYIPFGPAVISILQEYGLPFATVAIEPKMLKDRLQAFMISNQVISFFTETIFPWATRNLKKGAYKIQKEVSGALHQEEHCLNGGEEFGGQDPDDTKQFLKDVINQVGLTVYDVNEDYGEMIDQFGYITLFSVIWPLTGLCAFINNWIELRSDAAKICFHTRRPIPSRTDSIGPWIDNLEHLTWFSSLTNASILYLFREVMVHHAEAISSSTSTTIGLVASDIGSRLSISMLLVCLLASEHVYLGLRWAVKTILESIPTQAELSVRRTEYGVKRNWLTRLNDAIGDTIGSMTGAMGTIESPASKKSMETTVTNTGMITPRVSEDKSGGVETNGSAAVFSANIQYGVTGVSSPLMSDLGAQAIRSVFKAA
ncbi:hypothetical protein BGX27_006296 [Mortierella sp. AM989]|nr:hypothetical protein BGX27_006296 [Mortierella sp. AM989]